MERASGVILSISSLPSPYGIGTLGRAARDFADFLAAAGQRYWQLLPLGPTGYGDSPYSPFSTFAGNPYYLDVETMIDEGLLLREEADSLSWGEDPRQADYGLLYENRWKLLEAAARRGCELYAAEIDAFAEENRAWLEDYALFMALKRRYGMVSWTEWPDEDVRLRVPEALRRCREELSEDIRLFTFVQFEFFRQWDALRRYVHEKGVSLIGDVPIYVALDSSDVWASPELFELDERNVPTAVAGVPPDYFSEDGQLWGNPLYRWDAMAADGYGWWIRRIGAASRLYDVIRIDHFRGFANYWSIPYGEETAKNGHWETGPGIRLVGLLRDWFHDVAFIAEDLGCADEEVQALLKDSGFPGMRVLEFAFDAEEPSTYLPHFHVQNCVCYTGTHDNTTLQQWLDTGSEADLAFAGEYLGLNEREGALWGVIRGGMSSVAQLFMAQMQDYLGLGSEARMNEPGTAQGNWKWRLLPGELTEALAEKIKAVTVRYGRAAKE